MAKPLHNLTDQQLLNAFRLNDERAFSELFDRYFKRLYGFANSLLKDSETAKELAMDVMLRLWQKKGDIQVEPDLLPYLFRSVKNAVFNHLRKQQIITRSIEDLPETSGYVGLAADAHLTYTELESLYTTKLKDLPEQRRKIFLLSREEHLTYPEIAERLNLSVNTVRNQMSSSLQYFREQMGDYYNDISFLLLVSLFFCV